jgi:mono/diheme cytochrome c family protein
VRPAPLIAAALVVAAAAFAVVAFTTGDDEPAQRAAATPEPTAVAQRGGQGVWVQQGCGSCHKLDAAGSTGSMGPDLELSLAGMPAAYIEESIVAPSRTAAPGWSTGTMPDDYAARIPPDDLDALVRFLREAAGD